MNWSQGSSQDQLVSFLRENGARKKEGSNLDVELAKRTHSMATLHLPINKKVKTILEF